MSFRSPSPLTRLRVAARTDVGCRRSCNEDSFVVADLSAEVPPAAVIPPPRPKDGPALERWSFYGHGPFPPPEPTFVSLESVAGVALAAIDGMGGSASGDIAARIAADTFATALAAAPPSGEDACRRRVVAALNGASRAIVQAQEVGPRYYGGIAAAAVLALISGDRLHVAGAGDCRLYLLRLGRLIQLTRDDSLVNDYRAAGASEEQLAELPANVITKGLGLKETVDVTPSTFELRAGDVILLCTDGLHRMAEDAAIERVLLDLPDPAEACLALINLANRNGGEDNIAVVVARPDDEGLHLPGPEDALTSRNLP